jgi:D-alanine--D-alanine ligase
MTTDSPDERINLVVLFGGQSAEHDVSCVTAAHVLKAADPDRYNITAIGIGRDGQWQLAEGAMKALASGPDALPSRLEAVGEPTSAAPVLASASADGAMTVVLPLLHGPLGEDGTVQGMLELANMPYVGSGVLGSAISMDKAMSKTVLAQHGFPQARYRAFREHQVRPSLLTEMIDDLGLPLFVKPANMGSSVGVSKAKSVEELQAAIEVALSYDEWVLVEEAITGREIEVAVLGNREPQASVAGEIVPGQEFYTYEDKYIDDTSQALIPAPISAEAMAEVQRLSVEIFLALRCDGMARVDFFYEEAGPARGFLINEVNTIPGFTPISMYPKLWQASGVSYPELIDQLVALAIERHSRQRRNTQR